METVEATTPEGSPPGSRFLPKTSVTADHCSMSENPACDAPLPDASEVVTSDDQTPDSEMSTIEVPDSGIPAPEVPAPDIPPLDTATHETTILDHTPIHSRFPFLFSLQEVENEPVEVSHGLPSVAIPELFVPERDSEVAPSLPSSMPPGLPVPVPEKQRDNPSLDVDARMRETIEERRQQARDKGAMAMARFRLKHPANRGEDATGPATTVEARVDPRDIDWVAETESQGNDEAPKKFDAMRTWFEKLRNPTWEQTINYETAKREEYIRFKRIRDRELFLEREPAQEENSDNELFCAQDEDSPMSERGEAEEAAAHDEDGILVSATKRTIDLTDTDQYEPENATPANPRPTKRRRGLTLTVGEVRKSVNVGLNAMVSEETSTSSGGLLDLLVSKNKGVKPRSRARIPKSKANEINLETFFSSDIIGDAQVNATMGAIPTFVSGNKNTALTELLASIPAAGRDQAKPDKQAVIDATRKFTRRVRSDRKGGWRLSGLKNSLYHHQLLGAAFMRDRENSPTKPQGGMLCDVMGLGKSIQTLANIIDGQSVELDDSAKTTLIVAPRGIIDHWKSQIKKHCEEGVLGAVLYYHSKARLSSSDLVGTMQMFDVIITSYEEVRGSYPKFCPPEDLTTESQIQSWCEAEFKKNAGPLHQLRFRRIILDEGHTIRNPESQTSISVRSLHGHFKWILSGTPLLNHTAEFWPYFDFLGVPQIGRFSAFMHKFCDGTKPSTERLVNIVRSVVFRRTYAARLFSLPIVTLPDIGERTEAVEFCEVEKALYAMIISQFKEHIQAMMTDEEDGTEEGTEAQYGCMLTMILNLRMFNSHVLVAQNVVKGILAKKQNMADLLALVDKNMDGSNPNRAIVQLIQEVRQIQTASRSPRQELGKLGTQFCEFLRELSAGENDDQRFERMICALCRLIPTETMVTSCMHLFCEDCLTRLAELTDDSAMSQSICPVCDVGIEGVEPFQPSAIDNQTTAAGPQPKKGKKGKKTNGQQQQQRKKKSPVLSKNPLQPSDGLDEEEDEDDVDWVSYAAGLMPSAKLTRTRQFIRQWMTEAPDTKVVIFTQFRAMATIFSNMCSKEKWGYTLLLGNMSFANRQESIVDFQDDPNIQVMIASLKAGGMGLDLTMANKCILVEPWWNDAVQQQAFCRLFRIGQTKNVEIIKLVVKDTIDDYMLELQTRKNKEIDGAIGTEALSSRNTIAELLKLFVPVEDDGTNGF